MGQRVARFRTNVSEDQLTKALIGAWKVLFNSEPTKEQINMVLAQNAIETGHRKSMWNYNVGNITTSGNGSFNYFDDLTTSEQIKPGTWEKRNLKYRAYPSLQAGAYDYLKFLSGKKYAGAWAHIMNPNPVAFSKALKQIGYYTANEADYTKQLKSVYDKKMKNKTTDKPNNVINFPNSGDQLLNTVDQYLQQVAASEKENKTLYKKYLPLNNCIIKIQSNNINNSVEFARILCSTLDQELLAKANIHGDSDKIEVDCAIYGPDKDCFEAVQQLTNVLAQTFRKATIKIGGVEITTKLGMNKKSSYQLMDANTISNHYTKFLSKFKTRI